MAKPVITVDRAAALKLADLLVNKALVCDKAGKEALCTAHLEVAMKVMFPHWSMGPEELKEADATD